MNEQETIKKQATDNLTRDEIRAIQLEELGILKEIERIAQKYGVIYYLAYGSVIGAVREKGFIPWDTDADIMIDINSYERFETALERELDPKYKLKNYRTDPSSSLLFSRVVLSHEAGIVIHVDLFPMVGAPKGKLKQRLFIKTARLINQLFFVKQVDPKFNYRAQKKKRSFATLLKLIVRPIPTSLLIYSYKKLAKLYPVKDATHLFNLGGTYGEKELILKKWLSEPVYLTFETEKLPLPKEYELYLTFIYGDYMTPRENDFIDP